uniref:Uncharacterized protein n=1 Tax=Poecilia mexicana TaxID=48701 RepID=A0A3B3XQN4_9TELE
DLSLAYLLMIDFLIIQLLNSCKAYTSLTFKPCHYVLKSSLEVQQHYLHILFQKSQLPGPPSTRPDQQKPSHFTGHYSVLPPRETINLVGGNRDVLINNTYGDLFFVTKACENVRGVDGKQPSSIITLSCSLSLCNEHLSLSLSELLAPESCWRSCLVSAGS